MTVKIAAVQMDVAFAEVQANVQRVCQSLSEVAAAGARLAVFPECALTGYCYESLEEAWEIAEPADGASVLRILEACQQFDLFAVFGSLEKAGDELFNACYLAGPQGLLATYRKIHLPYLGVDRFVTPGDRPFGLHDVDGIQVGLNICYDCAFPESSRVMSLEGADLILLPTNWPPGAETTADYVINTRALENQVYYAAVDRIGEERGFRFIGKSRICDPSGRNLALADHTDPAILYAEIDPEVARNKRIVRVPDKHIIDRFRDRRPELYGRVVESPSEDG